MKLVKQSLLPALGLALVSFAPALRAQDMGNSDAASAAPSAATASAPSDDTPPPPPKAKGKKGGRMDPLAGVSDVTDDQRAKVKEIMSAAREKMQAVPDGDDARAQRGQIMKDAADQIRALLTPDQQAQFDANRKKMMRRKKAEDGGGDAPPPPPPPAN